MNLPNTSLSSSLTMNESSNEISNLNNTLNTSLKDKKDEILIKKMRINDISTTSTTSSSSINNSLLLKQIKDDYQQQLKMLHNHFEKSIKELHKDKDLLKSMNRQLNDDVIKCKKTIHLLKYDLQQLSKSSQKHFRALYKRNDELVSQLSKNTNNLNKSITTKEKNDFIFTLLQWFTIGLMTLYNPISKLFTFFYHLFIKSSSFKDNEGLQFKIKKKK